MPEIPHIKLSDLTRKLEQVIKGHFTDLYWIVAEISSHKFYPNQDRHYFDFVEKSEDSNEPVAKVKGIAWSTGAGAIQIFERGTGQTFTDGLQVLVKVKVEYHTQYGLSLVLHNIDQSFTLGNLERQRQETLKKLVEDLPDFIEKIGEEYLTKNKKISLPPVIQNIAIIGSPNSEGYIDFTHTINSNHFQYKFSLDIYQSSVQGADAELELISKLVAIFNSKKKYDCVVIIRGGGAKTDFLVFNSYGLSRAVAKFPIPVITGLGHHKDVSIVDLMTHTSTKTPTKAAEFIVSHNRQFEDTIMVIQKTLIIKSQQLLSTAKSRISNSNLSVMSKSRALLTEHKNTLAEFHQIITNKTKTILYARQTKLVSLLNGLSSKPKIITANKRLELTHTATSIQAFTRKFFLMKKGYLGHHISVINLMSPDSLLKKGFAIIKQHGKIATGGEDIQPGSEVEIRMHDYKFTTNIITKTKTDGTSADV